MTKSLNIAPEFQVQTWDDTARPLPMSALCDRVVVVTAWQVLCPKSQSHGIPSARRIDEMFEPTGVAVIGLHTTFEHHAAVNGDLH